MNHGITLSQAINGYLLHAHARRLSPHTVDDYLNAFGKFQRFLADDCPLAAIAADHVRGFLAAQTVSAKQVLNYHTALSALWTWAVAEGYAPDHILRNVPRPRPDQRAVSPFTLEDIRALLGVCERSAGYTRPGKRMCDNARPTGLRDRAMILLLLDTGLRASELVSLSIAAVDLRNQRISVWGKGRKQRLLPIGPTTTKTLWRLIQTERTEAEVTDAVFVAGNGAALTRDALLKLLKRLGARAGVNGVHPHRFRHTFAITYLRNGGNALALQVILGHTTLDMVRRYVQIAELDLANSHRTASPVENWRL